LKVFLAGHAPAASSDGRYQEEFEPTLAVVLQESAHGAVTRQKNAPLLAGHLSFKRYC